MNKIRSTRELIDDIMIILNQRPDTYISLQSIFNALRIEVPKSEIFDIAKYCTTKGWTRSTFTLGDAHLQITLSGKIYVEENLRDQVLHKERIEDLLRLLENRSEYNPGIQLDQLLNSLKEKLNSIRKIDSDSHRDFEILSNELKKDKFDTRIVEIKLASLSEIPELSLEVKKIRDFFAFIN